MEPCAVGEVNALSQVGENDNGEFKALGAVDAHDADDVGGLGGDRRLSEVNFIAEALKKLEESERPWRRNDPNCDARRRRSWRLATRWSPSWSPAQKAR